MACRILSSENITTGAASAKSGAAPAGTRAVILTAKTNPCWVKIGTEPVATSASTLIPTGHPYEFKVEVGEKVAALQDGGAGTLNVTWVF